MSGRLDQAALAVRTTLVLIRPHREGSNFRLLRYHASASAIFQKARTIDHAGVRYGSLRQAATWASAAASALTASIWISARPIRTMFSHRWKVSASTCRSCPNVIKLEDVKVFIEQHGN